MLGDMVGIGWLTTFIAIPMNFTSLYLPKLSGIYFRVLGVLTKSRAYDLTL